MFRRRLTIALSLLAAAVVLQGLAAATALGVAERKVQRGRVATDIQQGFAELGASKKSLRTWVAQHQQNAGADPGVRDALFGEMQAQVQRLQTLAGAAEALDLSPDARAEHADRRDALAVLGDSLSDLRQAVGAAEPLLPGADASQAWQALSAVFDRSKGHDLRALLAASVEREAAAVAREREAADTALASMRLWWLAMAATLALGAGGTAWHFGRALRSPLEGLSRGALALQQGRLAHRIAEQGDTEFSTVARSMNAMAAELQQHQQREQEQRQQLEAQVAERTTELSQALQALQQSDARRRQLFADVSHELRTPTTVIRGEAEVTLRGSERPAEEYRAALRRIVETSRQLGQVIDDLLAMARSDIDALSMLRRPLDLAEPLSQAVAQACALASSHGVAVQADAPAPGHSVVLGDAQRLRQLLLVLLDNAVRYSLPGGRVQVRVQSVRVQSVHGSGAEHWCVTVVDQGIGIPAHELPRVFERHFRGRQARLQRPDGSGLGLPIARALALAHGGQLELHSEGTGTTARLLLPAAAPEMLQVAA
jgi:two-component system, OmpR family, sensor kinase